MNVIKKKVFLVKVYGKRCPNFQFRHQPSSKMSETFTLKVDFDQLSVNEDVVELLSNNLREELNRDVLKVTMKESLALAAKGTSLQKGPANDLLFCILRALSVVEVDSGDVGDNGEGEPGDDDDDEQEQGKGTNKEIEDDETLSQMLKAARRKTDQSEKKKKVVPGVEKRKPDPTKKKDVCRFYTNGKCRRGQECRFQHPAICKKFRTSGSKSSNSNGCDGKCEAFHPNACRNSLRNKTCSFQDCRFYHLKGTKFVIKNNNPWSDSNPNQFPNQDQSQHRWPTQNLNQNLNRFQNNQTRSNQNYAGQKNMFTGLSNSLDRTTPTQGVQPLLNATLEAIMKRLTAMEERQALFPTPHPQAITTSPAPIYPSLSPTVPQPGTQTQQQWASQNQWTQSQY